VTSGRAYFPFVKEREANRESLKVVEEKEDAKATGGGVVRGKGAGRKGNLNRWGKCN